MSDKTAQGVAEVSKSDAGGAAALYAKLYHEAKARVAELERDAARLDHLDALNARKNAQSGTTYGWRIEENHNRIALSDHWFPRLSVREAIDASIAASKEAK